MFTIFIPVEGKVKYDCAMFRLWVWVYTGWDQRQQPAITFKDAIDVLFTVTLPEDLPLLSESIEIHI